MNPSSILPTDLGSDAPARTESQATAKPQPDSTLEGHLLRVEFTGSGSEYFRIWIVNLLLTLITFGLYYPWAKVRKLRYFYGNTLVGQHPLDFHGDPKRMLRGFLLVGALLALYSVAGNFSPTAGLIALIIVAFVWPALFRASQQFRMANTSWRGLRLRFTGDMAGAYKAVLPLFVPGVLMLALTLGQGDGRKPADWVGVAISLLSLGILLLFPLLWWMLKKYQHDHYAIGQVPTELRTGAGSFYGVFLKTIGVGILAGIVVGIVATLIGGGVLVAALSQPSSSKPSNIGAVIVGVFAGAFAVFAIVQLLVHPYFTSRLQNLLWNRTKSTQLRFESALRYWPLVGLTIKNWLLVILTLGLYWPFAAVATARLKLESVSVYTRLDPDDLVGRERARSGDAAGDAAGDLIGIDVGL
jgi:uncharacterized membrane protein YjgN (DUF898 family)